MNLGDPIYLNMVKDDPKWEQVHQLGEAFNNHPERSGIHHNNTNTNKRTKKTNNSLIVSEYNPYLIFECLNCNC